MSPVLKHSQKQTLVFFFPFSVVFMFTVGQHHLYQNGWSSSPVGAKIAVLKYPLLFEAFMSLVFNELVQF